DVCSSDLVHVAIALAGLSVLLLLAALAGLRVLLAVAAHLSVIAITTFAGLRILVGLATLGLHAALGLVVRAHALLLTRSVLLAALTLANRRRFLLLLRLGRLVFLTGLGAFVLRAHALGFLTRSVLLAALALANGRR